MREPITIRKQWYLLILVPILIGMTTLGAQPEPITGKWQHRNEKGELIEIEFSPQKIYNLSVNGNLLTGENGCGVIRYQTKKGDGAFEVLLFSTDDKKRIGKLQVDKLENGKMQITAYSPQGVLLPNAKINLELITEPKLGQSN